VIARRTLRPYRPAPMRILRAASIAAALFSAACSTAHDELSRVVLQPTKETFVEPAELGLDAEAFEVPVGDATLYGYLVRSPQANGRTVVLFHDRTGNVSTLHPYLTFLTNAGFHVCAFDYRGFGKSTGEPSLRGMFLDTKFVLDWLCAQRGVDANKIAFYGIGLGSSAALRAARLDRACQAMVLDETPSMRDFIAERARKRGDMVSTIGTGFTEFSTLPDSTDPGENAAQLAMPSLWILGAESPQETRVSTLRAWFDMKGDKQLLALPATSSPPHALLTHDGEYQRVVTTFLTSALGGSTERIATASRAVDADAAGKGKHQIELEAKGNKPTADAPWAIEVAAFDADGSASWSKVWLEGDKARVTLQLPSAPAAIAAMRVGDAERGEAATFARKGTPLSRAGMWLESKRDEFLRLDDEPPSPDVARNAATAIREREAMEPFPPLVDAELATVYAGIGRALARTGNAEDRAAAIVWLQRAIAAAPQKPERHWWPGKNAHYGFQGDNAVADARALLKKLTGS
jgi:pimeloyl-ACP methyl ester carboxylesterase